MTGHADATAPVGRGEQLRRQAVAAAVAGRNWTAWGLLQRAAAVEPASAAGWNALGNVALTLDRTDDACTAYRRSLGLHDAPVTRANLAGSLMLRDDLDAAEALIRDAAPRLPARYRIRWIESEIAARRGDAAATIRFARMAISLEPAREDAWLTLAAALEATSGTGAAVACYRRCVAIAGPGATTARGRLAALGESDAGSALDIVKVRTTFDNGAPDFDALLYDRLAYRGPAVLAEALGDWLENRRGDLDVLDIGCGTGGCGHVFASSARHLHGIDLSPTMIACARRTGRYHRLSEGEMNEIMRAEPPLSYDLVLAADVLTYVHAPGPVLREVARLLRAGGRFAGAQELWEGPEASRFLSTGRFAHSAGALAAAARDAGLVPELSHPITLRLEEGRPIPGLVVVLRAPDSPGRSGPVGHPIVASPWVSG